MFETMVHKKVKHKASWPSKVVSDFQSVNPKSIASSASGNLLEEQIIGKWGINLNKDYML